MNNDQLLRLLDETRKEVERAENKASILLAGGSLAIGTVVSVMLSGAVEFSRFGLVTLLLFVVTALGMLSGLTFLGLALIPRLKVNPGQTGMTAYFGHVLGAGSLEGFERLAAETIPEEPRLTNQIWTLSLVIGRKYGHITRAFHAFGVAIAAGILAVLANAAGL